VQRVAFAASIAAIFLINIDDNSKGNKGGKGTKKTQDEIIAVMPSFINLLFD
jgi:hypothetical protein